MDVNDLFYKLWVIVIEIATMAIVVAMVVVFMLAMGNLHHSPYPPPPGSEAVVSGQP